MHRRTALFAFPGVAAAFTATCTPHCDQTAFDRTYARYKQARAIADEYLDSDRPDEDGYAIFDELRDASKALMLEPAPSLDALSKKLNCFHREEMYLGTVYGEEASHCLANDSRRLTGQPELEPLAVQCDTERYSEPEERPMPEEPGFSADEFAERKFRELVERYPDSWRYRSFCDYERLNADLYAVYLVSIDRRFLVAAGERIEAAMNDNRVKCWGVGSCGGDRKNGFGFVTVVFFEADNFEAVKDQFKVNAAGIGASA